MTTITNSYSSVGTISSAGVGSGLDVASIVSKLMAVEQQPLTNLQTQATSYNTKISAIGTLNSLLSTLQEKAQAFATPSSMVSLSATVADTTVASASVTSGAVAGSYSLAVSQLAAQQKLVTADVASSSTSLGTGSGSITIDFGTTNATTGAFTANASRASVTINLSSSQMTLAGVRDAINTANQGVTATILNDGSGARLVLTNSQSGASQSMRVSVSDPDGNNTDASGLSILAYNPSASVGSGKNMTQTVAASDASYSLDGVSMTSTSNTITDAITGVTLNLAKTNVGSPTTLNISSDASTVTQTINDFISAYNSLNTQLKAMTAYNATTGTSGTLQGDSTVLSMQRQLRNVLTNAFGSGSISRLNDIGVTLQSDGSLKLDSTRFSSAFTSNRTAVLNLFTQDASGTAGKGLGGTLSSLIDTFIGSAGSLTSETSTLSDRLRANANDQTQEQSRLDIIQARYQKEFSSLDLIVSQGQALSSYLTQQFFKSSSSSSG